MNDKKQNDKNNDGDNARVCESNKISMQLLSHSKQIAFNPHILFTDKFPLKRVVTIFLNISFQHCQVTIMIKPYCANNVPSSFFLNLRSCTHYHLHFKQFTCEKVIFLTSDRISKIYFDFSQVSPLYSQAKCKEIVESTEAGLILASSASAFDLIFYAKNSSTSRYLLLE